MELQGKIISSKIVSAGQLTAIERRIVGLEPELAALIDENAALCNVVAECGASPLWEDLRCGVLSRARELRAAQAEAERIEQLPVLRRLLFKRPWYLRAALALVIMAALSVLIGSLPYGAMTGPAPVQLAQGEVEWYNYSQVSNSGRAYCSGYQHVNHP